MTVLEAAPTSRGGTVFCTTSTRFCMVMPTPQPMMNIETPTYQNEVS